jgi:hypothetical protein
VKRLKLIAAATLSSLVLVSTASFAVPACAIDGGVAPPECALEATKADHPDWYRSGGYCELYVGHQPGFNEPPCRIP